MPLIKRSTKGSGLTNDEIDGNFTYLLNLLNGLQISGGATVTRQFNSIVNFDVPAQFMSVEQSADLMLTLGTGPHLAGATALIAIVPDGTHSLGLSDSDFSYLGALSKTLGNLIFVQYSTAKIRPYATIQTVPLVGQKTTSGSSNTGSGSAAITTLTAPVLQSMVALNATDFKLTIANAVANASGYKFRWSQDNTFQTGVGGATTDANTLTATALGGASNAPYYGQVMALGDGSTTANSGWSNMMSVQLGSSTSGGSTSNQLATPLNPSLIPLSSSSARAKVDVSPNATNYYFELSTSSDFTSGNLSPINATTNQADFTGLNPGTFYTRCTVTASGYKNSGPSAVASTTISASSGGGSTSTGGKVATPVMKSVTEQSNGTDWVAEIQNVIPNASGYNWQWSQSEAMMRDQSINDGTQGVGYFTEANPSITTHLIQNGTPGVGYWTRCRAGASGGYTSSDWSAPMFIQL